MTPPLLLLLQSDFNVDFEDDTGVTALSLLIQDLYRKCAGGQLEDAHALLAGLDKRPDFNPDASRRKAGDDSSDDEDDDEEGEGEGGAAGAGAGAGAGSGASRRARVVDEDGWETVPSRGRGGAPGAAGAEGAGPEQSGGEGEGGAAGAQPNNAAA